MAAIGGAALGGTSISAEAATPAGGGASDGVLVPEHVVPVPNTISPQAQAFLRFKPPLSAPAEPKSRNDFAGWQAYRQAADMGMTMIGKMYVANYPAEVVTHKLSAANLYEITPHNAAPENAKRTILYIHGGGFISGGGENAIYFAQQMAGMAKTKVFSVDYRLAPENPFPLGLDDCVEAYRFVLGKYKPGAIAMFGPSAGANMAPACILRARDQGLPLPAACGVHSAPSDIGDEGDSAHVNIEVDTILRRRSPGFADCFGNGHDPKDPHISPVYGDFAKGFCPTILTTGTRDLLLSGTVRLHRALRRGGIKTELHVWEAMPHVPFGESPEQDELYGEIIHFMLAHMTA